MNKNKTNKLFPAIIVLMFVCAIIFSGCGNSTTSTNTKPSPSKSPAANNTPDMSKVPAGAVPAHYKGGAAATVVVEEFADYQCPTCAVLHPTVQQLQAAYGDRVKIIFRNFPLQTLHPKAYDAAVAAEAAGLQGKFWEMQNLLFTNQQTWSTASDHRKLFEEYAQRIGLDLEKFKTDMAGMEAKTRVDKDMERGRAMNLNSTPSFYINGKPLAYENTEFNKFRAAIDAELAKTQQPAQQQQPAANQPANQSK